MLDSMHHHSDYPTCRLHDYNYLCIIQHKLMMTLCYLHNHFPLRISVAFHLCCLFIWIPSYSSLSECNLDSELTSLLRIHLLQFLSLLPYHYLSSSLYLPLSYSYIDYLHCRMGCLLYFSLYLFITSLSGCDDENPLKHL